MTQQLVQGTPTGPLAAFADRLPPMIASADDRTAWRFVDFFAVTIRNPNTREAYYRAVSRFMDWCEQHGLHRLAAIRPIHVAAYVEQLPLSRPSVRQHLSAISRCFDWMVSGGRSTPTRRRRSRDRGTSSGSAGPRSSATTRPGACSSPSQPTGSRASATAQSSAPCSTPSAVSAPSSPWTSRTTGSATTSGHSCSTRRAARSTTSRHTTGWWSTSVSTWTPPISGTRPSRPCSRRSTSRSHGSRAPG